MLKNSKSIYFIKKLFTFLDEKTKLDIIKYNKNMQNILDISLINYKFFSDRYIIFEKIGKETEKDESVTSMVLQNMKENIYMEKEMEKEKNMMNMESYYMKENI